MKLRSISTSFWSDTFIEGLTVDQKLLYIYFITNERTNMLGIYEISDRKISFETGVEITQVKEAIKIFEDGEKVKRVKDHILICNYLKHQNYNPNMMKSAIDIFNGLPTIIKKELRLSKDKIEKKNPSKGFERVLFEFGMLSKEEREYELEEEREEESETPPNPQGGNDGDGVFDLQKSKPTKPNTKNPEFEVAEWMVNNFQITWEMKILKGFKIADYQARSALIDWLRQHWDAEVKDTRHYKSVLSSTAGELYNRFRDYVKYNQSSIREIKKRAA